MARLMHNYSTGPQEMKFVVLIFFLFSSVASLAQTPKDSLTKLPDSVKISDTSRIDSLKANTAKADTAKIDTAKGKAVAPDTLKNDIARIDSVNTNVLKADSVKAANVLTPLPVSIKIPRSGDLTTPGRNSYGGLLNDDPIYNPRYPLLVPASRVILADAFTWATDRYIFNYDWARISATTWKNNLRMGWEWDNDKFGINFIGHPHSGNVYFNIARSNGYNFWQSFPFAVEGSLIWEYFGENTRPSINDIINTPVSGAFLGEVVYRISSNILDDRTRGAERFFREFFAGIINPPRALNRLTQGKMFRVT